MHKCSSLFTRIVMFSVVAVILLSCVPVSVGAAKTKLYIFNCGDYIAETTVDKFEKAYPEYEVVYEVFDTNEAMYQKLVSSNIPYDILIPSDYMIERLIKENRLKEIDTTKLENYHFIGDSFKNTSYDPQNKYSVPYMWGTLGILYNKDKVDEVVDSWSILWNEKYKGQIQFVFKPHPFLKRKLNDFWGEEKTNDYYNRWATMDNTQIVEGDYLGLFKYSDAMIHDCVSFTIEYCYTKNPVMYLIKERDINGHRSELNEFGQRAFDLHTHGCTKEQIKAFIQMVAEGKDDKKDQRVQYYNDFLLPPCGKSACENIINAILGQANWEH